VSRIVVLAVSAGGDLQPLVSAALALRERGHDTVFLGDRTVEAFLQPLGIAMEVLPAELDLGPRLGAAIREAMEQGGGDLSAAGPVLRRRMSEWAAEASLPVSELVDRCRAGGVVTSLFGVEVVHTAEPPCPWAVINSTFYVGPNPPRPLEVDVGPRALPLIAGYAQLLGSAPLVLHATDQVFDFGFAGLPAGHHYVGALGIWEPPSDPPTYLDEPGDPWVLVTISSQLQDDVPLVEAAIAALADRPVRVVVTLGPDHSPDALPALPANVRVEQTVSHAAVLKRGALMVSHAGHGSVMKALWHGRPMVLVPWGRDQPGVAARAEALGVARVVDRAEASAEMIERAVGLVLDDERMVEAARAHSDRLRATDPPATAAALIGELL
jgi:UDP:flavonoid glycosyltransferase YjiC (YdhE family)